MVVALTSTSSVCRKCSKYLSDINSGHKDNVIDTNIACDTGDVDFPAPTDNERNSNEIYASNELDELNEDDDFNEIDKADELDFITVEENLHDDLMEILYKIMPTYG